MPSYRTIQGDTWDGIAYKLYGQEGYMMDILALNPDQADMLIFPAGVVLLVPEASKLDDIVEQKDLPPWI
ncbi:MAG: tail protein X [Pseudomonadota bacterium]